jgi:DNA-binding beta-propeller fold protein YncE
MVRKFSLSLFLLFICGSLFSQSMKDIDAKRILLPNGWAVTPVGQSLHLGDLPLNIAVSSKKTLMAVTNNGQSDQTIFLIDPVGQSILDTILMGKSYVGIVFSEDEKYLYASGGNDNWIVKFDVSDKKLVPVDTIVIGKPWPNKICISGITLDDKKGLLYAVTTENNSLYVIDINRKVVFKRFDLGGEAYTCLLSPDRNALFISCWGCDKVIVFDTRKQVISGSIPVGDNPNDMCITKNGSLLFVANANDNSVSVISLGHRRVIETLNAALYPNAPSGSTTNAVALSEDEKMLYVANADNNCLALFDLTVPGFSKGKGFIPTGWYPTAVKIVGSTIFVANGKGFSSMANPNGPNPIRKKSKVKYQGGTNEAKEQYIGGLFHGTMSMIPIPNEAQLSVFSQVVYDNTPYKKQFEMSSEGRRGGPIPQIVGAPSPIKHVFYIIKENRTYDQVLGDVKEGNGDSNLVLFGKKITPNQHKLVHDFVLLDNFYVNGEVSADGHNWSTGAYATDFLEKNWPTSYGGRGGEYNAEGTRDVANNKNGFIWDFCKKYGVTYRTYGEFADDGKPNIPALKDHLCPYYTGWEQDVMDTTRFSQWKRDFDSLLAIGQVPQMNTLRFINDHTMGLSKGKLSPFAQVGDNDLAVGLFIEHLSKSKIWNESAVFIVEDDAQAGPDHVDAHRSTVYIAGGMVKKGYVDHNMYSTASVLRTMELILGLPPMSQYDASAPSLWRCFNDSANHAPFQAMGAETDLRDLNTAMNHWQKVSDKFDFTAEDRAPDQLLNQVLWVAAKGESTPYPATVHSAFVKVTDKEKDDD